MFPTLKSEVEARFGAIEKFLQETKCLEGDHAATAKGLMFVQVYAVYEYTVRSVVRAAVDSIRARKDKLKHLSPSMLALFLDPEWESLRDSGRKSQWQRRLNIMERAFSNDAVDLSSDTKLPDDGSHFRYTHLLMIFKVFGISRLPVRRRRHRQRIDEVVAHRNSIAHGEEKADDIGRRYSRSDIRHMTRQMKSVCLLQVEVFESFCSSNLPRRR